jgi:hypothetical protein
VAALATATLAAGGVGLAGWRLRAIATEPRLARAADERRFLERAEREVRFWSFLPLPAGAARAALLEHARYLEEALAAHPAIAEPASAVHLGPAQYRTAAEDVALAARHLGPSPARAALVERLEAKARIAAMPRCEPETAAAWDELWRTTADPALRDGAIAPRLRPALAALLELAEREADATPTYPEFLLPLLRFERAHAPVVTDLIDAAKARQWERALAPLPARLAAAGDTATIFELLARAPEPPPASVLRRAGHMVASAALAAPPPDPAALRARAESLLGEDGALAMAATLPPAYHDMAVAGRDVGPRKLEALVALVAAIPRGPLSSALRARLAALDLHLAELGEDRAYSLRVARAWVGPEFDSVIDDFDMVIAVSAERAPERVLGPFYGTRERAFEAPLFRAGELRWRPWERLEVRVTDDKRAVGLYRRDPGSCFGLAGLAGEWKDPAGHGGMTIEVSPRPPAPFEFVDWPG